MPFHDEDPADAIEPAPPVSHGAERVAQASFGTVIAVGISLFIAALITGQAFSVYLALVLGLGAAGFGYWLWTQGFYGLATAIHTGGLICAGIINHTFTETLGGGTAVLFLASVITAGGLLGWRGAVAAICGLTLIIPAGAIWAQPIRTFLGGGLHPYDVSETMMTVFVLTSIPSWGAYVVAIDASNRAAWIQARAAAQALERSNRELADTNRTLLVQRDRVQRAVEQQAAVARLGLYANGPATMEAVTERASQLLERWCDSSDLLSVVHASMREQASHLEQLPEEDRPFARGVLQVVQMRAVRSQLSGAVQESSAEPPDGAPASTASEGARSVAT